MALFVSLFLYFFFFLSRHYIFRAVFGSQQNREAGTESFHVPPASHTHTSAIINILANVAHRYNRRTGTKRRQPPKPTVDFRIRSGGRTFPEFGRTCNGVNPPSWDLTEQFHRPKNSSVLSLLTVLSAPASGYH